MRVYSYYPIPILARGEHGTSVRVNALGRVRSASTTIGDATRRTIIISLHLHMHPCVAFDARTREREREKEEEKEQWIFPTAENLSPTDVRRAIYMVNTVTPRFSLSILDVRFLGKIKQGEVMILNFRSKDLSKRGKI